MKKNIFNFIILIILVTSLLIIKINNNDEPISKTREIKVSKVIKSEKIIKIISNVIEISKDIKPTKIVLNVIEIEIPEPKNLEEANKVLDNITIRLANAVELLEALKALGYSSNHPAVVLANTEILNAENNFRHYEKIWQKFEEEHKWEVRTEEYPVATEIWLYFKNLGYNDWVCAGIVGNIMTEVGGQTLAINYNSYGDGYYGICQWNRSYSAVWDTDLKTQCDFLAETIQYEIDTYGYAYQTGFSFNDFLNLTNEQEVALVFAKAYERCDSASYSIRQTNATIAYEYFTE